MKIPKNLEMVFEMACRSDATVLINGATGTGKTSLAREIHDRGARRGRPFVVINLACIHEGTLESELFGHEKGAFTGADRRRIGKLEAAQGGTVFLDEVGELPPRLQARLLDFLQSKTICPVGGNRDVHLDVRVIAATHRNLEQSVRRNEFREDLFHRLRVVPIPIKSLRERNEEFEGILNVCLVEIASREGRLSLTLSGDAYEKLTNYPWPGNIRELRNVLEFAVLASKGPEITPADLPSWFLKALESEPEIDPKVAVLGIAEVPLTLDFHRTFARFEKNYLGLALGRYGGKVSLTARKIGISKTTLLRRIRAYSIQI